MMTKWTLERKWEKTKQENRFEKMVLENGFEIIGFKEFISKTDYLLSKDGTEIEASVSHNEKMNLKKYLEFIKKSHETKKELDELKKELKNRS